MGEGHPVRAGARRGAGRALQALRAQQGVGQARRYLGAPGRRREGRQVPRGRAPAPRPPLHGEGREQREGHRGLAAPARARREQPPRAGRAQEALRHRGALGRSRRVLPLAQQDRRVHPRPRARGRGRQRAAPIAARDEDRGALPRRAAEARSRDARLREGAHARREQPARRRGADPALRGGPRSQGARARARDPAPRDPAGGPSRAPGPHPQDRAVQRREAARQGRGLWLVAQGARGRPRGRDRSHRGRAPRGGDRRLEPARRGLSGLVVQVQPQVRRAAPDARARARHREGAGRHRSRAGDEPRDPRAR